WYSLVLKFLALVKPFHGNLSTRVRSEERLENTIHFCLWPLSLRISRNCRAFRRRNRPLATASAERLPSRGGRGSALRDSSSHQPVRSPTKICRTESRTTHAGEFFAGWAGIARRFVAYRLAAAFGRVRSPAGARRSGPAA